MAEFNETWYNNSIEGVVNAHSLIFLNWVMQRTLAEDCILAKIRNLIVQTVTCVDAGPIKTVWQNSMRLGTVIVQQV